MLETLLSAAEIPEHVSGGVHLSCRSSVPMVSNRLPKDLISVLPSAQITIGNLAHRVFQTLLSDENTLE